MFSCWNYRIVKKVGAECSFYGLYEVFYDDEGNPCSRTENPVSFVCDEEEGVLGITESLKKALKDAEGLPVLCDSVFRGAGKESL